MGYVHLTEQDKEDRIRLLNDETKTDAEVCKTLNLNSRYLSILRKRWGLPPKQRGMKKGTIVNAFTILCKICGKEIKTNPSDTDRKYCSRECMYSCKEYRETLSKTDKSYMNSDAYRLKVTNPDTPEFRRYSNRVHKLTQKTFELNEEDINPHGFTRALAGTTGAYHLDHIMSIRHGYENGIEPEVLAQRENLQMLPWRENIVKG